MWKNIVKIGRKVSFKIFSKKLKKMLDKPFLFWYYSGVAFERPKNSGTFERGDLKDLAPSKKLEKSFKKLKKST